MATVGVATPVRRGVEGPVPGAGAAPWGAYEGTYAAPDIGVYTGTAVMWVIMGRVGFGT